MQLDNTLPNTHIKCLCEQALTLAVGRLQGETEDNRYNWYKEYGDCWLVLGYTRRQVMVVNSKITLIY